MKAFIGQSTPIGYCTFCLGDEPFFQPVLEASTSLFLLYDEIWFLSRELCPYNMRDLPYTFFLNEEFSPQEIDYQSITSDADDAYRLYCEADPEYTATYSTNLFSLTRREWRPDGYCIFENVRGIGSMSAHNGLGQMMADALTAQKFGFSLILNEDTARHIPKVAESRPEFTIVNDVSSLIAEKVIVRGLPCVIQPEGPYFKEIDAFRSDYHLSSHLKEKFSRSGSDASIELTSESIINEIELYSESLVRNQLSTKNIYLGVASAIVGQIPVISNIFGAASSANSFYSSINSIRKHGWISSVVEARSLLRKRS